MVDKYDRFWFAVATELAALYGRYDGKLEPGDIDYRIRDIEFGSGGSTFTDTARVWQAVPMPGIYQSVLQVEFDHPLLDRAKAIHEGTLPIHYEWRERPVKDKAINISVHFEFRAAHKNRAFRDLLKPHEEEITRGIDLQYGEEPFRKKKGSRFLEPSTIQRCPDEREREVAHRVAEVMKQLIERTWPIIRGGLDGPGD